MEGANIASSLERIGRQRAIFAIDRLSPQTVPVIASPKANLEEVRSRAGNLYPALLAIRVSYIYNSI